MLLNMILVTVAVLAIIGLLIFVNKMAITGLNKKYYEKRWREITSIVEQGETGARLSIIEADKLLDHALKQKEFSGEKMADRMRAAKNSLNNENAVWNAHKLRNRLVHEENVKLSTRQAKSSLKVYRSALKGLGAL